MNCQTELATSNNRSKRPAKTEMIRARMDLETKEKFESVLNALGVSVTEAITLFAKQVIRYNGIPLRLRIPNDPPKNLLENKVE